jgi:hypothetical protein
MKRLTPTEPKDPLEEVEFKLESQLEPELEVKPVDALPKSKVYSSIKRLSSFKQLKSNYKMQTQKQIFVTDVRALLQHLDVTEHKMDTELLVEVLNACEEYFVYGEFKDREESKSEAVKELMTVFFDSELVLNKFVSVLGSKVKRSTPLRRLMKKMYNFFF